MTMFTREVAQTDPMWQEKKEVEDSPILGIVQMQWYENSKNI